jgi:hypothetical protein
VWTAESGGDSSGLPTDGSVADDAPTDGIADAPETDKSCAAMARQLDCTGCCQQIHATGVLAWIGYWRACLCADGSLCQSACAMDICAGPPEPPPGGFPAGACLACVGSVSPPVCGNAVGVECSTNADCEAYFTCENGCRYVADAGERD